MDAGHGLPIEHVFVLMLENHSFDNLLGFSGIPGVQHAWPDDANCYDDIWYSVGAPGAPVTMPTDPGHEIADVTEQLCGNRFALQPFQPYPTTITKSGFVSNYATSTSEQNPRLPVSSEYRDVMACFDTPHQLKVLHALATQFTVCDMWFASVPGPTFPNRFFLHGASSNGWADTPSIDVIKNWITSGQKFTYPSGASIFDRLAQRGNPWRVYYDTDGPAIGSVPWVTVIEGVDYPTDVHPLSELGRDLAGAYPYAYTFIEPNYGDIASGTFAGGSSQHPCDGMGRGEALIKTTYELVRNSSIWEQSLLVVLYDEHGGFYDSVAPGRAVQPDDGSAWDPAINACGFLFDHYGVRVPAVVVSPWTAAGVDHTVYDHASVPATIEHLFGLAPLTARDAAANHLGPLIGERRPRTDCPLTLPDPVPDPAPRADGQGAGLDDEPLPDAHSLYGALASLALADLRVSSSPAEQLGARRRFASLRTRGDARAYADEVVARLGRR